MLRSPGDRCENIHIRTVATLTDFRPETRAAFDALRAALPLVQQRRGATEIREKSRNDIVTATDVLVQSTLQDFLHEQHPDIAFLGEEGIPSLAHDAKRTWLVDPICGTTNYAAGIPLFAINVALVEDSRIVAAAVAFLSILLWIFASLFSCAASSRSLTTISHILRPISAFFQSFSLIC